MAKNRLELIKCALNQHSYSEPVADKKAQRMVKICVICGNKVIISHEGLDRIEERKLEIINDIKNDKYYHAKMKLEQLLKDFGY